jgi:hypothetical protein
VLSLSGSCGILPEPCLRACGLCCCYSGWPWSPPRQRMPPVRKLPARWDCGTPLSSTGKSVRPTTGIFRGRRCSASRASHLPAPVDASGRSSRAAACHPPLQRPPTGRRISPPQRCRSLTQPRPALAVPLRSPDPPIHGSRPRYVGGTAVLLDGEIRALPGTQQVVGDIGCH